MWKKYIIKKLSMLCITLLLISILTFFVFSVLPGDASVSKLGTDATPERIEALREEMGLNQPVIKRYVWWLADALHFNFGESYQYEGVAVQSLVGERLGITALLTILASVFIILISFPLGVFCGKHKGKWVEGMIHFMSRLTMAVPPFFLGVLLTFVFGILLHIFTPGAFVFPRENFFGCISYLIFPAISIALPKSAMTIGYLSAAIKRETNKDYVRTAYSKGCSENQVFYCHILKNAMIPVITFLALVLVDVIAGSLVVEQVFSVPGIGRLLVTAISNRDFPVVQAVLLLLTGIVVIVNCFVDIIYHWIDPRVEV